MLPNEMPAKYGPRWFETDTSRSEFPSEQFCTHGRRHQHADGQGSPERKRGEKVGGSTRTSFSWPGQSTIVAFPVVASTDLMCRSPDGCWYCSACGGTFGTGSFWFVTCANVGI